METSVFLKKKGKKILLSPNNSQRLVKKREWALYQTSWSWRSGPKSQQLGHLESMLKCIETVIGIAMQPMVHRHLESVCLWAVHLLNKHTLSLYYMFFMVVVYIYPIKIWSTYLIWSKLNRINYHNLIYQYVNILDAFHF
jgi:hypothetical protein